MKHFPLSFPVLSFLSAVIIPAPFFNNSPVLAQTSGCGSGSSWYLTRLVTPVSAQQFGVACNEHDACYDTFGRSKDECDRAFHNRMLEICSRDHNTLLERPLKATCSGTADAFYTAVREGGQSAYNDAQAAARPTVTTETLPTTVTDVTLSGEECYEVNSRQGWQYFTLLRPRSRVTIISGSWSVDARNYRGVGGGGHFGEDARSLEPYNQYKYDQGFPFGALFVDIPTDGYGYVQVSGAQTLPRSITRTAMRINDADNALGDNGGSLRVCFGS